MDNDSFDLRTLTRDFFKNFMPGQSDEEFGILTEQSMDLVAGIEDSLKSVIYPESSPSGLDVSVILNPERMTYTISFGTSLTLSEIEEEDMQSLVALLDDAMSKMP